MLDVTKSPVGNGINVPVEDNTKASMQSPAVPTSKDLGINPGASSENLSAKYKNPNVTENIPDAGKNQYESTN